MSAQRSEFVSALTAWNDTATGYPRDGCLHALFDARAADEFHIFVAPKVIGGGTARSPVGGRGSAAIADALRLAEFTAVPSGEDVYLHGIVDGTVPPAYR